MTASLFCNGSGKVSRSLLIGFVETFQKNKFREKFQISLLSMNEYLRWVVEADTASLQQVVAILNTKTRGRRSKKSATEFAATDDILLEKSDTEHVG